MKLREVITKIDGRDPNPLSHLDQFTGSCQIIYVGSTTWFEMINVNSNKCLDVVGAGTTYLTNIQQYTCTGVANQLWNYDLSTPSARGSAPEICAGVYTGTANNKEPLVQAACAAGNAWDVRYTS